MHNISIALSLLIVGFGAQTAEATERQIKTGDDDPQVLAGGVVGSNVLQFYGQVPKNILFYSIDTFRKDHFGPHSNMGLTPFFDELAQQSMVMEDHLQCSDWTYASTTCTLAGRSNIDRGHMPRLGGNVTPVPFGTPFLATWLGDAGYYSIIVSSNSWLSNAWGNVQGFDEAYNGAGDSRLIWAAAEVFVNSAFFRGDITDGWFLHMHMFEPHPAYDPQEKFKQGYYALDPGPFGDLTNRNNHYNWNAQWPNLDPADQALLEAHLRSLYEADVRMTDHRARIVWEDMMAEGFLDDTLVVFWNDHGEQFWEHQQQTHAWELYGEENDGFLMFWANNIVPGTYSGPTHTIDVVPTILDLQGLPIPPEVTGVPIGSEAPDRARFGEVFARAGGVQSIQKDGYKLHYRWNGEVQFYDRSVDPDEQNDLYDPGNIDPKALELWNILRPEIEAMAPLVGGANPNYPPELP